MALLLVFTASAASLALEAMLARYFALSQWHHLSFMVISVALLGFSASGTWLNLVATRRERSGAEATQAVPGAERRLRRAAAGMAVSSVAMFLVLRLLPLDFFRIPSEPIQLLYLGLSYLACAVPFFFAGLITAIAFAAGTAPPGAVYAAAMSGSAAGVLLPVLLLPAAGLRVRPDGAGGVAAAAAGAVVRPCRAADAGRARAAALACPRGAGAGAGTRSGRGAGAPGAGTGSRTIQVSGPRAAVSRQPAGGAAGHGTRPDRRGDRADDPLRPGPEPRSRQPGAAAARPGARRRRRPVPGRGSGRRPGGGGVAGRPPSRNCVARRRATARGAGAAGRWRRAAGRRPAQRSLGAGGRVERRRGASPAPAAGVGGHRP